MQKSTRSCSRLSHQVGDAPTPCTANTSYPAVYGAAGICEILDPYIKAYDFDIADFADLENILEKATLLARMAPPGLTVQ